MAIDIVRGVIKNIIASKQLVEVINEMNDSFNGTLYLGYPLLATDDNVVTIDALLITKEKGLVAFIFDNGNYDIEKQDKLYFQINNTLYSYESLRKGRKLAIEPIIISFVSNNKILENINDSLFVNKESLIKTIENLNSFDSNYYNKLIEALQKVSSLKPKKKRQNVASDKSLGSKIKTIEQQITNLDQWQKKAAFEIPEGPQRIRGLAGSGKTIVLALKAAYLHVQHPDWNIAVTFYTRSLYQQFKDLITNFYKEYTKDDPDWTKLHILHAWGTYTEEGIYSIAAKETKFIPLTFENAASKYGHENAFAGICQEAISFIGDKELPIFDAILIDEGQDLPSVFFKLCYQLLKNPKRISFAYDELQNLSNRSMPSLTEMFGKDQNGNDIVLLNNNENEAKQDIVLPICYRNTPWALTLAHSLGFGIYNKEHGIFQLFSDKELWTEIGYSIVSGSLKEGNRIVLRRSDSATPSYFRELLNKDEAIMINSFKEKKEQYIWVANQIKKNITEDELDPDDILVIFPETYKAKMYYLEFRDYLLAKGINSNLVGVNTDRDTFKEIDCVTCSHIYRAKGNEAPMVYILNADYCFNNLEMRKVRNILFTAITRSRAWVRICGVGENMASLEEEANMCIKKDYELDFVIPTEEELEKINLIHREKSENEIRQIQELSKNAEKLISLLKKNKDINLSDIPKMTELLSKLKHYEENDSNE